MASFVGKVGALVSGRGKDEYRPVQMDEAAESRVSLSTRTPANRYTDQADADTDVEASVGLLSHEPLGAAEAEVADERDNSWRKKEKKLCMCCGVDLTRFFKVLGVVGFLAFLFGAYKLLVWAFHEPPKGLKKLPEFGTSLGCLNAPYFYNNTETLVFDVPMHPERFDHGIDIHGGGVGTLTLTSASTDSPNIRYEISLRSNNQDFVQKSIFKLPHKDPSGNVYDSVSSLATPVIPDNHPELCLRYDVKMYVPPSLKNLHLASHALAHFKFDKDAKIKLEKLFVSLFAMTPDNMIQASTSVKSDHMSLEVIRGWIVGDIAVVDEARIVTQRGDGKTYMDVYPEPPKAKDNPETISFQTTTGAGTTAVFVHKNKGAKRPIVSEHISSRNGPVKLTYKDAGFNGLVDLVVGDSQTTGLKKLENAKEGDQEWTHFAGDKNGADRISIDSRGWVGLYL